MILLHKFCHTLRPSPCPTDSSLEVSTDSPSMRRRPPCIIHFSVATLSQNPSKLRTFSQWNGYKNMGRSAMEKRGVFRKLSWEWTYDDIWIFFLGDITARYLGIIFLNSNLAMNNRKSTNNIN